VRDEHRRAPDLYENYALTDESHIFDFDSNVYGDMVRLYFHHLLRREQQFRSALELNHQIRQDIERSRRYFERHPVRFNEIGVPTQP
jgi:riboflavin kinase/FMN adenylyltransferase